MATTDSDAGKSILATIGRVPTLPQVVVNRLVELARMYGDLRYQEGYLACNQMNAKVIEAAREALAKANEPEEDAIRDKYLKTIAIIKDGEEWTVLIVDGRSEPRHYEHASLTSVFRLLKVLSDLPDYYSVYVSHDRALHDGSYHRWMYEIFERPA